MADVTVTVDFPGGMQQISNPPSNTPIMASDPTTGKPGVVMLQDLQNNSATNVIGTITTASQAPTGTETQGQAYDFSDDILTAAQSGDVPLTGGFNVTIPQGTEGGSIRKQSDGSWVLSPLKVNLSAYVPQSAIGTDVAAQSQVNELNEALSADNTDILENLFVSSTTYFPGADNSPAYGNFSYYTTIPITVNKLSFATNANGVTEYGYMQWGGSAWTWNKVGQVTIPSDFTNGDYYDLTTPYNVPANSIPAVRNNFYYNTYSISNSKTGYLSSNGTSNAQPTGNELLRQVCYTVDYVGLISVSEVKANADQVPDLAIDVQTANTLLFPGNLTVETTLQDLPISSTSTSGSTTAIFGNYGYKFDVERMVQKFTVKIRINGGNLSYGYLLWNGSSYDATILGTITDFTPYTEGELVDIPIGINFPQGAIPALSNFYMNTYSETNENVGYVYTADTSETPAQDGQSNYRQLIFYVTYNIDSITSLNNRVSKLENNTNPLSGLKIVGVGDSIMYGFQASPITDAWLPLLCAHLNAIIVNQASSGMCITTAGAIANNTIGRFDTAAHNSLEYQYNQPGFVPQYDETYGALIIALSTNDSDNTVASPTSACAAVMNKALYYFTNTLGWPVDKIKFITSYWHINYDGENKTAEIFAEYDAMMINVAQKWNIVYCSLSDVTSNNISQDDYFNSISGDGGLHPGNTGHAFIENMVGKMIFQQ